MATEKKVFDVGKPGLAKPETGSKPMVIGHKTLLADPTLKSNTEEIKTDEDTKQTEKSKIELKPISDSEKEEINAEKTEETKVIPADETKSDDVKRVEAEDTPEPEQETNQEQIKQDKQKEAAEQEVERAERLEAIIKSKEYFVPVKESNKTAVRTFTVTLFIVILVGIIITAVLIDAEILDLGVDLPFNLL